MAKGPRYRVPKGNPKNRMKAQTLRFFCTTYENNTARYFHSAGLGTNYAMYIMCPVGTPTVVISMYHATSHITLLDIYTW